MDPTPQRPDPERQPERQPVPQREVDLERSAQTERSTYQSSGSGGQNTGFTDLPNVDPNLSGTGGGGGGGKKKKSWLMPVVAAICILGALAVGVSEHGSTVPPPTPPQQIAVLPQDNQVLTLCGADLDQTATTQAVADLKSGAANPLLANLSAEVKQELLSGDRQFYRVPMKTPQASDGDRVEIDFNGSTYGVYNLVKDPISLDMPLRMGDHVAVKCLSVAQGKSTVTVDLATVLNPVQCDPLAPGQVDTLSVTKSSTGQNYDWFIQEASQGNAVAQYGLGHMYQYGLGVAQDRGMAIHWYQMAAAQNYQDAQAQLTTLMSSP